MMPNKSSSTLRVTNRNRKFAEALLDKSPGDIICNDRGIRKLADSVFGCDLPSGRCTHKDLILNVILDRCSRPPR